MISKNHPAFAHLPEKLTISFPIWGLYDIDGKGIYADTDRMVREHVARGFNCIRLDDGAGLMHDFDGNPRGPIRMGNAFGPYDDLLRQFGAIGGEGLCDPLERLIQLAQSAKKYGVYLILSSWYYLHTYWYAHDKQLNDELFAVPPEDRFMVFAKFLHYILLELEKRKLSDCIAFAEIFNEADGLYFIVNYNKIQLSDEQAAFFRKKHEEALEWLQKQHPDILFGYDVYHPWTDRRLIPSNMQVFNFHSYYLWNIYFQNIDTRPDALTGRTTEETARKSQFSYRPETDDSGWHCRIAAYDNLDIKTFPVLETQLENDLKQNYSHYLEKAIDGLSNIEEIHKSYPNIPIVSGEGVSYIGSKELLWEEHSERYWELVEEVVQKYRDAGLWGTVVRTCCGPEDPSWDLVPEKLLRVNKAFQEGK